MLNSGDFAVMMGELLQKLPYQFDDMSWSDYVEQHPDIEELLIGKNRREFGGRGTGSY